MKKRILIDKVWEEITEVKCFDEVLIALIELLSFDPGEGYFLLCSKGDGMLKVDNGLKVIFLDARNDKDIYEVECKVRSWQEMMQVCKYFYNCEFERLLACIAIRQQPVYVQTAG